MTLRIGSLFSGIGGLELGVEAVTGGRVLWQVERDPWCRSVLARHWPDAARFDDVCTVGDQLAAVDLICGGFPCQPASVAGKRKGMDDDRWLWPQFARIVGVVRPRLVLLENVPGLLTVDGGRAWGSVLGSLASLGYDAEWGLFRASDAGAPQRRERVFCLAHTSCVAGKRRRDAGGVAGAGGGPQSENGQPRGNPLGGGGQVGASVADAGCSQRRAGHSAAGHEEGWHPGATDPQRGSSAAQDGDRPAEPGLGGDPHGVSSRLDGHRWPAGRGENQHPWEPPRLAPHHRSRQARLRALGNAVVPQCAALALQTLADRAGVTLSTHPDTDTTHLHRRGA